MGGGGGALDPQGPVAEAMADLWWLMLWLGVAVFVVFAAMLAVALLRRPDSGETDSDDDAGGDGRIGRWLTGWGVIGPAVIIIVVFVATVYAMRVVPSEAPDDAVIIEVVGYRWWYEVRYPGAGVTTSNELHLPTGRPVALRLTSADVIHSFWVPELGGKRDMLPDGVNTLVLEADRPGVYRSQCAEFCGLYHTDMALTVVAQPPDEYEAWLQAQREVAAGEARANASGAPGAGDDA